MYAGSGTGGVSKSVEFLEKLQTAFDPPIFGTSSCKSFIQFRAQKNLFKGPKSTTNPEQIPGGGVKVLKFPLFCLKKLFFCLKNSLFVS